jgi:polyphosphate kinase
LKILEPELIKAGIRRVRADQVDAAQHQRLERFFDEEVFTVVTPEAVEAADEFPVLSNLGLHVAVRLKSAGEDQKFRYAVIPIGSSMRRFVSLPAQSGYAYMPIEDVMRMFIARFFPGAAIVETVPIRIARNADLAARDEYTDDFLSEMKVVLDQRRQGGCVRLEVEAEVSRNLLAFLQKSLRLTDAQTYEVPGILDLSAFKQFAAMEGFEALKYEPWPAQASPDVDPQKSLCEQIARKDILLFHPYESFDPVTRFVQEAANDPNVLAIKQILYRTSSNSPIVTALRQAAERGKYVTALVELKARFDEARNIEWARDLERAGVQVIYGVKGLKTHAKICIVVRREHRGVVRYLHFGTGNYNERTARIYSDVSYMTCNPDLAADGSAFFNAVSGYSEPLNFLKLSMAPFGLRKSLLILIRNEADRRKQGQDAAITAKVNSLADPEIIEALYEASQAGVKIQLNVRGICCLRPGVEGLSENISVVSIVDRYLEHARIACFHSGGEQKVFISSADWMPRNLDRRVELLTPVDDPACKKRLLSILSMPFKDRAKARRILPDGKYEYLLASNRKKAFRSQEALYEEARQAIRNAQQSAPTILEPLRPPNQTNAQADA